MMTTITQTQIDQVNALYKDPETGKGILDGWGINNNPDWICTPAGVGVNKDETEAITRLVHKLLEQEQSEPVYVPIDFPKSGIVLPVNRVCPSCGQLSSWSHRQRFCPHCGVPVTFTPPPPVLEPEPMDEFEDLAKRAKQLLDRSRKFAANCQTITDARMQDLTTELCWTVGKLIEVTRKQQSKEQA